MAGDVSPVAMFDFFGQVDGGTMTVPPPIWPARIRSTKQEIVTTSTSTTTGVVRETATPMTAGKKQRWLYPLNWQPKAINQLQKQQHWWPLVSIFNVIKLCKETFCESFMKIKLGSKTVLDSGCASQICNYSLLFIAFSVIKVPIKDKNFLTSIITD